VIEAMGLYVFDPYPHPKGYVCYRAEIPIAINGSLDDDAWKNAPWTDDFTDIEGDKRVKPRFRTRVKLLWDSNYLYIAAQLEEPHVWATLKKHDSVIFHDNDFEVFIDPDGDNHQYYEYEINAFGTDWDLRLVKPYRDGGPALDSWEITGIKKAVRVNGTINNPNDTDTGWTVEIAMPWRPLAEFANRAAPPKHGDQWRINFSRVEWIVDIIHGKYRKVEGRPEDNWVWSPQGAIDMHRPERWGYLQFSEKPPGTDTFHPDPTHNDRVALMNVYYAQKAHFQQEKRWADSFAELGLNLSGFTMRKTPEGWIAVSDRSGLAVQQDSKLFFIPNR
jgi:hypothetical protein